MFLVLPGEPINVEFTDVAALGGVGLIVAGFSVCSHLMHNPNPKWDFLQHLMAGSHTEHSHTLRSVFRGPARIIGRYGA